MIFLLFIFIIIISYRVFSIGYGKNKLKNALEEKGFPSDILNQQSKPWIDLEIRRIINMVCMFITIVLWLFILSPIVANQKMPFIIGALISLLPTLVSDIYLRLFRCPLCNAQFVTKSFFSKYLVSDKCVSCHQEVWSIFYQCKKEEANQFPDV